MPWRRATGESSRRFWPLVRKLEEAKNDVENFQPTNTKCWPWRTAARGWLRTRSRSRTSRALLCLRTPTRPATWNRQLLATYLCTTKSSSALLNGRFSRRSAIIIFLIRQTVSLFAGPSRPSDRIAGGGSAGSWRLAPQFLFGGFLRRSARLLGSILAVPQSCLSSQEACSPSSSQMSSLPTSLSSYNSSLIRQTGKFISSILSLPLNWIEPCQSNAFVQLFCIALSFSYLIIICSRMSRNRLVSFSFFLFQKCYSNLFL